MIWEFLFVLVQEVINPTQLPLWALKMHRNKRWTACVPHVFVEAHAIVRCVASSVLVRLRRMVETTKVNKLTVMHHKFSQTIFRRHSDGRRRTRDCPIFDMCNNVF